MQIRCLWILLLVSTVSCSEWHGLKAITINKDGMLDERIQKSLESALKWMENAVLVQDSTKRLTLKTVNRNMEGYKDGVTTVTVQTPNKLFSTSLNSPELEQLMKKADITVFIKENTPSTCQESPYLKATGGQYTFDNDKENKPYLGFIEYCYREYQPEFNYFDLFRHELLHALGYGTISPEQSNKPQENSYQWKFEDGTQQTATRYFFNTPNNAAINEVKKHFNCNDKQLNGVESDSEGKHLNEYIFFNELMTPSLGTNNFFSYISAAILENVYFLDKPWYKVNRTFIAPEADAYIYGKGFGCTFLLNSCYDFLKEKKTQGVKRPIPFCPENSEQCFNKGNEKYPAFACTFDLYSGYKSENGILPSKSTSKYNNVEMRYCPIFTQYYELEKFPLVKCSHNPKTGNS